MRAVFCEVAVDYNLGAEFDVAAFEAAAGQGAGASSLQQLPVDDVAFVVGDVDVEIRMRVGPLDLAS